jgi:hypothetical protein
MTHIKQALRLFRSEYAPKELQRANAMKWLRSVSMLGDRWVLRGGANKWGYGKEATK